MQFDPVSALANSNIGQQQPVAASPSFDPVSALQNTAAQTQLNGSNPSPVNTPIPGTSGTYDKPGIVPAVMAGYSNFGVGTAETALDAGLWAAGKLGKVMGTITPEDTNRMQVQLNNWLNTSPYSPRTTAGQDNVFGQSIQEHPYIAAAAKYVPAVITLAKTALGNLVPGASAGSIAANVGLRAGANAGISAGLGGASDVNHQNNMALMGAGMSVAGDAAAAGLSKGAKALDLENRVKSFIQPITDQIKANPTMNVGEQALHEEGVYTTVAKVQNDANYSAITSLPANIRINPTKIQVSVNTANTGKALTDKQTSILETIQENSQNLQNMDDAVKLRQYIAANKSQFSGNKAGTLLYNRYNKILNAADEAIKGRLTPLGLGSQFEKANEFYSNVMDPLNKSGAVDRLDILNKKSSIDAFNADPRNQIKAPLPAGYSKAQLQALPSNLTPAKFQELSSRTTGSGKELLENSLIQKITKDLNINDVNFDKNVSIRQVNQTLADYKDQLSPKSLKTLEGIKTLLREAGATGQKAGNGINIHANAGRIVGSLLGSSVGGYEGYQQGGGAGMAAGMAIGGAAGAYGVNLFKSGLADTRIGQAVLRKLSDNPKAARELIQNAIQAYPAIQGHQDQ